MATFQRVYAATSGSMQRLESTSLPLDVLDMPQIDDAVLQTSVGGVGVAWAPLGRGSGACLLHHLVDLLERQTLGVR